MKILCLLIFSLVVNLSSLFSQTKPIDAEACNNWERLDEVNRRTCLLSSDGDFVLFKTYSDSKGSTTILKNLKSGVERHFSGTYSEELFNKERYFAFRFGTDSLMLFDSSKNFCTKFSGIKGYQIFESDTGSKIVYFTEVRGKITLKIWDLKTQTLELPEVQVEKCWFNKQGTGILMKCEKGLVYTNMENMKQIIVNSNIDIENAAFSNDGTEVAYIIRKNNEYKLMYFNLLSNVGLELFGDSTCSSIDNSTLLPEGLSFNNNNGDIFFKISPKKDNNKQHDTAIITNAVDIWSYQDVILQEKQLAASKQSSIFTAMINVKKQIPVPLETDTLKLALLGNTEKFLIQTTTINEGEFYWNKEKRRLYLFCIATGERRLIKESVFPGFEVVGLSPDSKFLIWFDGLDGNFYSYDIKYRKIFNISKSNDNSFRNLPQRHISAGLASNAVPHPGIYWVANNTSLIVSARNDIWQLDPRGANKPINLTNGYGEKNNISFRLIEKGHGPSTPLQINDCEYLVSAFENRTKKNGFWKIKIGKSSDPNKLIMSDEAYFFPNNAPLTPANSAEDSEKFRPIRALKSKLFVIRKMSSSLLPNLYATSDFKTFKQISNIHAPDNFVSIITKLITYRSPNGNELNGVLHVPKNLDTTKLYPVIFNYYELRSSWLNIYRTPELSGHNINIPWYLSRGYLVFEPDLYYDRGKTAQSVIECVEAAVKELVKMPYIDQTRMGLQGQSHGGYETNVLVTGTNLFSAACEMAGYTNVITEYGSMRPNGHNNQSAEDIGQRNLGAFPWDHPEIFIENSPVFHVRKIKAPLLMVHNKKDGAVAFSQAIELFLAARRLGKKVWMLQYDGEGHTNYEYKNKLDFTIRMQQFFDHYLKGSPAPLWMTRGLPAKMKGKDSGLELDMELKTPGEGIATPAVVGKIF